MEGEPCLDMMLWPSSFIKFILFAVFSSSIHSSRSRFNSKLLCFLLDAVLFHLPDLPMCAITLNRLCNISPLSCPPQPPSTSAPLFRVIFAFFGHILAKLGLGVPLPTTSPAHLFYSCVFFCLFTPPSTLRQP